MTAGTEQELIKNCDVELKKRQTAHSIYLVYIKPSSDKITPPFINNECSSESEAGFDY